MERKPRAIVGAVTFGIGLILYGLGRMVRGDLTAGLLFVFVTVVYGVLQLRSSKHRTGPSPSPFVRRANTVRGHVALALGVLVLVVGIRSLLRALGAI